MSNTRWICRFCKWRNDLKIETCARCKRPRKGPVKNDYRGQIQNYLKTNSRAVTKEELEVLREIR